jgi:hypothetical protein
MTQDGVNIIKSQLKKRKDFSYIFLFLMWPFFGLFTSFNKYRSLWSKDIFWFFCVFVGLTFVIPLSGPDSSRYALKFIEYSESEQSVLSLLGELYRVDTNYVDVVQPLITFLVSRLTSDPKYLFAVFGLVFGFFYSRNIWYIIERIKGRFSLVLILLVLTFALLIPIWFINGFRMYCAAQIFVYGAMPYLMDGDKKRLIWVLISVLVHFSFLFPVLLLLLFLLMGNRLHLYFWFFIISSFITELNLQTVSEYLSLLPDIFRIRMESYTGEDYARQVQKAAEAVNWYIPYSTKVISWIVYGVSIIIYFNRKKLLLLGKDLFTLFCFALFFYGWAEIISNIPSGVRFLTIGNMFMFAFFIWYSSRYSLSRRLTILKNMTIPLLLLFIVVSIRVGFDYMGITTILGNPFIALVFEDQIPLIDYVKLAL